MNANDEIIRTRNDIYNRISRILTDYEENGNDITIDDFYTLLCDMQNSWDNITCDLN